MNLNDIVKGLRELGLKKNDVVVLHSALSSLGEVEGGAGTVVDAFMKVLGSKGALIVPAFGRLGAITDVVKNRPDAVFSNVPVGTLAGIGGKAAELLADHWSAETAHGEGTPYPRIAEAGGYVCLLGVDQDRNTMLHSAEALLKLPYLKSATCTCKDPEGHEVTRSWPFYPGPHRNFIGLDRVFRDNGIMKIVRIGNAQVRLIDAHEMLHIATEIGAEDPAFVLCDNPACADCVAQRAKIAAASFAKESFRLSASSRLCGRYVPEMVEKLQAAGLGFIELDYVQGKACAFMGGGQLAKIVGELKEGGIVVSGLRVPVVMDCWDGLLSSVQEAGISRVILPLMPSFSAFDAFSAAGVAVDFANVRETSVVASAMMGHLQGEGDCGFAMSPTGFVRAGEKPFLKSWRQGRFARTIRQLDVADCTWSGDCKAFAEGNAEIKELVSIVRCRNFDGWMTLGGGAPYPHDLALAVRNFTELLENI